MTAKTKAGEDISHLDANIQELIHKLDLEPHPEANGTGFYRETYREAAKSVNGRSAATAIYFLLTKGGRSHWHAGKSPYKLATQAQS